MFRKLFETAGVYALSSVLSKALPFLLIPVFTRYLSPNDYGLSTMFITLWTFLGAFVGLSVHGAVSVRYFDQEHYDIPRYVDTCIWILLFSTTLVFGVVVAISNPLSAWLGLTAPWLCLAVLCAGVQFLANLCLTLWQVEFAAKRYALFQVGVALASSALAVVLVVFLAGGWKGRVVAHAATLIGGGAVCALALRGAGYLRGRFDRNYAADAIRYGAPLVPHVLGGLLIALSDRLIVVGVLGLEEAGIYAVGAQVAMVVAFSAEAFNRAYGPWLFSQLKMEDEGRKRTLVRFTYLYFAILIGGVLAYALLAPWLFGFVVGDAYVEASGLSAWLALGGAFQAMYYMVALYIAYASKTRYLAAVTIVGGLLNVPLTLELTKSFGILGAAYANVATQAAFFISTWVLSHRSYPMPWREAIA